MNTAYAIETIGDVTYVIDNNKHNVHLFRNHQLIHTLWNADVVKRSQDMRNETSKDFLRECEIQAERAYTNWWLDNNLSSYTSHVEGHNTSEGYVNPAA